MYDRKVIERCLPCLMNDIESDYNMGLEIDIVAKGDIVADIIKCCMVLDDIELGVINYDSFDYVGEYYIGVGTAGLFCEPCWHKDKNTGEYECFMSECDIAYFINDIDEEVVRQVGTDIKIPVIVE